MTTAPATSPLALREATLDDAVPATRLLRGLGLALPESDAAAREHWARLWRDNPALALATSLGRRLSPGWVLEHDGAMAGFFGSIPIAAAWGAEPVIVAVASQWGVLKQHRADTPRLADAYFTQAGADVLLVTSAIAPTGRIFERHGGARLPVPEQDRVLFWITRPRGFIMAALRKSRQPAALASAAGRLGAPMLDAMLRLSGRRPSPGVARIDRIKPDDIDDAFDDLWRAVASSNIGPRRLRSVRDAAHLRWHFGPLAAAGRVSLLVSRQGGALTGYLALLREDAPAIGLERLRVADILLRDEGDGTTLEALLRAAIDEARASGCAVLEVVGLPTPWRERARALRPLQRSLPTWPVYMKALRPDLIESLRDESAWFPTAFDGDSSLF